MYLPPRYFPHIYPIVSLLAISNCLGSPLPEAQQSIQHLLDCNDTATTFDESCWDTLDMGGYLNDPVTGWNHTVPICQEWDRDSTCCLSTEPWTTCYLRLAHGVSGADCSQINAQTCSYDATLHVNPSIQAHVHYTLKNIYGICPKQHHISEYG